MWEAVETKARKIRVTKAKGRRKKEEEEEGTRREEPKKRKEKE